MKIKRRILGNIYVYDISWEDVCILVDSTSPYALTGAIFAKDKEALRVGSKLLTHSAGNELTRLPVTFQYKKWMKTEAR